MARNRSDRDKCCAGAGQPLGQPGEYLCLFGSTLTGKIAQKCRRIGMDDRHVQRFTRASEAADQSLAVIVLRGWPNSSDQADLHRA